MQRFRLSVFNRAAGIAAALSVALPVYKRPIFFLQNFLRLLIYLSKRYIMGLVMLTALHDPVLG